MSQDHIYEQRWEFRRKGSDLDSSSDDKGSNSARNRKLKKSNQLLSLVQVEEENQEEETSHNLELNPPKRAKNRPNSVKKTREQKPRKNTKKSEGGSKKSGYKDNLATAIQSLEKHVNVLVKELNTSREGLMKWMEDELKKLVPESSSASPSKPTRKGKRQITKMRGESESVKKTPSKKINANGSSRVTVEQHKPAQEAPNLCKTATVRNSGMVSTENPNMGFLPSNYLNNLPNLNPRPLAENYLVKPNSSTLRIEPVVLNSSKDPLSVQQQSAAYYQGITLQSERDFDRSVVMNASLSSSIGSYGGGFPSASHLGFKGGFNLHNLGLTGSEFLASENNFSGLSNNHMKYSN